MIERRRRHELMRGAQAALMALVLVLSNALATFACTPQTAAATEAGCITITRVTDIQDWPDINAPYRNFHAFEVEGSSVADRFAYCADKTMATPGAGLTLTGGYDPGNPRVDYVLYHGYSSTNTEGYGCTPGKFYTATQYALWLALPDRGGSHAEARDELSRTYRVVQAAVRQLLAEADAYAAAGGGGPEAGCATVWPSPNGTDQGLVTRTNPTGGLELVKASANASMTENNGCYRLSGATYGVYADSACANLVTTLVTDDSGHASADGLMLGTYYVRETSPAPGFALDGTTYEVHVSSGATTHLNVSDVPQSQPVDVVVTKVDAATPDGTAQGEATLAGAEFTVRFYAGSYASPDQLPARATRSWVLATDADGTARLDSSHLVSGDDLYRSSTGAAALPLGTVTVEESKAPAGYLLAGGAPVLQEVTSEGTLETVQGFVAPTVREDVLRGGVSIPKIDHDLKEGVAQGDATLAGAIISVTNASARSVMVGGQRFAPGEEVMTLTTGADGRAATSADILPFGTYTLSEKVAPRGYERNATWSPTVSVQRQGIVVEAQELPEDVTCGGGAVMKLDAETDAATAQGDATLAGAEISLYNRSEAAVTVGGVLYQPGDVVSTLVTDEAGRAATAADALPFGTYEARETKAPVGYLPDDGWSQSFEIRTNGQVVSLEKLKEPICRGGVSLRKADADGSASEPQGDATLAGTEFTIYNRSASAVLVGGSLRQVGEAVATLVADEAGRAATAADALPFGTYEVRETAAPSGYELNDAWAPTFQIRAHGQVVDLTADADCAPDAVVRGGVRVRKADLELQGAQVSESSHPLGAATLDGARVEVTNRSARPVLVGGVTYAPGEVVLTLVTDEAGAAATAPDALPFGTYELRETAAPAGYLLNENWTRTVQIREAGRVYDLTSEEDSVADQAIRGDLSWSKAEAGTQSRMAHVPFKITSQTTGEWHVVTSDENGMVNTASDWYSHSQRTNAGDAALRADGTVDEALLDAGAGVWFSGRADAQTSPDDTLGALPFDTYLIEELPCAANEGHLLVSTFVTISRNAQNLDLGTMDDEQIPEPALNTDLTYGGLKVAPAEDGLALTDSVRYEDVVRGQSYRLVDELHAVDPRGGDLGVIARAEKDLTPELSSGAVEVTFEDVDASGQAGRHLVACTELRQGNAVVARHSDLADEGQTVRVPAITTALLADATASHVAPSYAPSALTDTVALKNLTIGLTYTVHGTLRAAADEGADQGSALAEASTTFVATSSDMEAQVSFDLDAPALAGATVNAAEELLSGGMVLATHDDIADEGQSVHVPALSTVAHSQATGSPASPAGPGQVMVDVVGYQGLLAGETYTLVSSAHVRDVREDGMTSDGGTLPGPDGAAAQVTTTFTTESGAGEVSVEIPYDATGLDGRDTVAFEELYDAEGALLATHADVDDAGQTLHVPSLGTEASADATASQVLPARAEQTIRDCVHLENLVPGQAYELAATVHLKGRDEDGTVTDLGELTDADGAPVTARTAFVAEDATADVELSVAVDASELGGKDLVFFERLSAKDVTLALHADVNDAAQTLSVPAVSTTATDDADGDHALEADGHATIVDEVAYENLVPGLEYELAGTLHARADDGSDAGELSGPDGTPVRASTTFTPTSPDGTALVTFELDATSLAGRSAVAFEELCCAGTPVASHAEIADEGQTVGFSAPPAPSLPPLPFTGESLRPVLLATLLGTTALALGCALRRRR